jgi:hypothetical protein
MDFFVHGPNYYRQQLSPLTRSDMDSSAKQLGTWMHEANLEGKLAKFVEMPEVLTKAERKKRGMDSTKSVAEIKEETRILFEQEGKTIVTDKEMTILHSANHFFNSSADVQALVKGCEVEKGYRFLHAETGTKCRFRTDLVNESEGYVVDYKTTSANVNPHSIDREIAKFKYHLKAAHYLYGLERLFGKRFVYHWIFQASKKPYSLLIKSFSTTDRSASTTAYNDLMKAFKAHSERGFKDDFTTIQTKTKLPAYAFDLGWVDEK